MRINLPVSRQCRAPSAAASEDARPVVKTMISLRECQGDVNRFVNEEVILSFTKTQTPPCVDSETICVIITIITKAPHGGFGGVFCVFVFCFVVFF